MSFKTSLVVVSFALLVTFVLLNWATFLAPTSLSFGIASIEAPLGLVMLGFTGLISAAFLLVIAMQQAASVVELRKITKELRSAQAVADKAESSRISELRETIRASVSEMGAAIGAQTDTLQARLSDAQATLSSSLVVAERSVAAHLGEIEDKLDQVLARREQG